MKKCTKCGEEKDLSEFAKCKSRKDGLQPWCRSCRKKSSKEYYIGNKDKIKEYYIQNKNKIIERVKEYQQTNKDKIAEYQKEYKKEYMKNRRNNDPEYRLLCNIRRLVSLALNSKNQIKTSRTAQFVDVVAINKHLGPRPEGYHLDHIIPLSKFDLTNPEHLKLAHLPQNLRYIPALENISKSDTIVPELIASCPILTEIALKIGVLK